MEAGSKAITLSLMAETTPLYQIRLAVRSELEDIAAGDSVLVAASGGADSSALAAALLLECKTKSIKVIALIIDHGLQKNSADVTHETKRTLTKIGYENIEIRRVTVEITDGLEASARRARYQALNDVANSHNAVAVFLGHTRDDQAETVLLGLARGSGSRSLSGMASRVDRYRRPLLSITRAQTEAACEEAGIKFWQDPHNQSMEFTRVRVREVVLPTMEKEIGPGISDALARSAKLLRDDADALDYLSDEIFSKLEPASLEISKLESQPRAIRTRVLRKAIYLAGAPQGSLSAEHIEPVEALITAWKGQGPISLPGGVTVARISGRLSLSKSGGQGQLIQSERTIVDLESVKGEIERVVVTDEQLQVRLKEIAAQIEADYKNQDLLLIGVLKGAVMVMADLSRYINRHLDMDWMAVSSYGSGTKSSGVVRIMKDLDKDITGRNVLIVEDIVDTGLTLDWLSANLKSRGAKSVEIMTVLRKPDSAQVEVAVKYVGFDIPKDFVIGYGLDFNEKYRNLPFIAVLAKHMYE